MKRTFRIGTRGSRLARWQTDTIISLLQAVDPGLPVTVVLIKTAGDQNQNVSLEQIGDTGLFTKEIESALLDERIDIAVHSLKDLASELPDGLVIGAVPVREDVRDVLISHGTGTIGDLPRGARVLTGSLRRKAQLLNLRNDLKIDGIRGNIETRLKKFHNSRADALIMAAAGIKRLELADRIASYIPEETIIPAVGQGALAVEVRRDDKKALKLCGKINNKTLEIITNAERSFLRTLQGGCQVPVGGTGRVTDSGITLSGVVASLDGRMLVRDTIEGKASEAGTIGIRLAEKILNAGGREILESFRQ